MVPGDFAWRVNLSVEDWFKQDGQKSMALLTLFRNDNALSGRAGIMVSKVVIGELTPRGDYTARNDLHRPPSLGGDRFGRETTIGRTTFGTFRTGQMPEESMRRLTFSGGV